MNDVYTSFGACCHDCQAPFDASTLRYHGFDADRCEPCHKAHCLSARDRKAATDAKAAAARDEKSRGQAPIPGGLIGSARVPASGTIFQTYHEACRLAGAPAPGEPIDAEPAKPAPICIGPGIFVTPAGDYVDFDPAEPEPLPINPLEEHRAKVTAAFNADVRKLGERIVFHNFEPRGKPIDAEPAGPPPYDQLPTAERLERKPGPDLVVELGRIRDQVGELLEIVKALRGDVAELAVFHRLEQSRDALTRPTMTPKDHERYRDSEKSLRKRIRFPAED